MLAFAMTFPLILLIATWPPDLSTIVPVVLVMLPVVVFATLTVTVSSEAVEAAFGPGVLRRRTPLPHIRGWRIVDSPLHHGIGMRMIPGGTLYNVRSGPAVELLLENDRVLRIGTDEPQRLVEALSSVHKPPVPDYPSVAVVVRPRARRRALILAIVVLPMALLLLMIRSSEKPPRVRVSNEGVTVSSSLYSVDLPWQVITDVTLEDTLPRITRRTNGYALGGTLRGYFNVEGMGRVRLFIERDQPPFVRITSSTEGVTYVGLGRGGGTRQLFQEISRVRRAVGY